MRALPHDLAMTDRATLSPLDVDWHRLRRRPDVVRRATSWCVVEGPVDDLDTIVAAIGPTIDRHRRNDRLRRLLERAAHDDLAGRVVVQALLPDLVRLHRRRRAQGWARTGLGDLLTTTWVVVRTFNPDRRPSDIAASLVSDVDWREYRAPLRRKADHRCTEPDDFDRIADDGQPSAFDELVELLTRARTAGLPDDDLDLLCRLASGRRSIDVAAELGVTARTVRNRRERVAGRLRELSLAA